MAILNDCGGGAYYVKIFPSGKGGYIGRCLVHRITLLPTITLADYLWVQFFHFHAVIRENLPK